MAKPKKRWIPYWKVRFSILTIRGDKREIHERRILEPSELSARNRIKRAWMNSKPRILSVKKDGGGWFI